MQKAIKVDKVGGSDVMKLVKVKLFPPPKDNEVSSSQLMIKTAWKC